MSFQGSAAPFRLGRRPILDGFRGAAILAVLLYHYSIPFGTGGFLGVDAFFVLSGFLITSLLTEEWSETGNLSFNRFYTRRALRLLPALFSMLAGTAFVAVTVASREDRAAIWRGSIGTVLYLANWQKFFDSPTVGMLGHTWSLSIEEQFYVLWPPLLLLLLRRLGPRRVAVLAAALAAGSACLRAVQLTMGASTYHLYNGTHTRLDSLLIGCAAALMLHSGMIPRGRWPLPARLLTMLLGLALCVPLHTVATPDDAPLYLFGFFVFACGVAAFILASVTGRVRNVVLESPAMVWLGARSYSLYLWHLPVRDTLQMVGLGHLSAAPLVLLNLTLSIGLASLSYRFIEQPALKLKQRFAGRLEPGRDVRIPLAPPPAGAVRSPAYGFVPLN